MKITATIHSSLNKHETEVQTNDSAKSLHISPKPSGYGSSINGGELLMLALATCFCNDIYREAAKRDIEVSSVDVHCSGDFGADGDAGTNFTYAVAVKANASDQVIKALIRYTDEVAEIHNTLRKGIPVQLVG